MTTDQHQPNARDVGLGWLIAAAFLTCLPVLRMSKWVLSGSETQYADYWLMVDNILAPGGGLRISGLAEFSNEHPVVIPKLVYWLNIQLTGGSNISLGLYVLAVTALQLGLLLVVLRWSILSTVARTAIIAVASCLIYSHLGAWNFMKAMSGTAWLTANTLAIAAIVTRWRGRLWTSCVLGVLACLTYGTGLAIWPALRNRERIILPIGVRGLDLGSGPGRSGAES